jgi:hypothetical protein
MAYTPYGNNVLAESMIGPDAIRELMRQIYNPGVLEHLFAQELLINVFDAPIASEFMENLSIAHSIRITYKNWRNPLTLVGVSELAYKSGEECPKRLDIDCTLPDTGPLNTWVQADVDLKWEYSIGVDICVKNERLYPGQIETEYAERVQAVAYLRSLNTWNSLADQIIKSGVDIMIPRFATKLGGTNYYQAGAADFYETASTLFQYMESLYGPRFKSDFVITIHPELALEIMNDTSLQAGLIYTNTGIRQSWLEVDQAGYFHGFQLLPTLPRWYGISVLVAPDNLSMHYQTPDDRNYNPWENEDGTAVRMIVASRRCYYTKTVQLMDKRYFPATVDNPVESIREIWIGGDYLLFPEETFLIEFTRS